MSKNIENIVFEGTEAIVSELGYELADVDFKKEAEVEGWVLTLYIYRPEGISVDDCEKVSRAVDPIIEGIDPTEEPYFLSVSSLGLDRSFSRTRDFERYLNRDIEIKLYAPIDPDAANANDDEPDSPKKGNKKKSAKKSSGKRKEFVGVLRAVDEESLTLEVDGLNRVFQRSQIAKASPSIKW